MAKRRARDIAVPESLFNNYPRLLYLASGIKSQELLGNNNNLPRRWANAYRKALRIILEERHEEDRIKIIAEPTGKMYLGIPLHEDEVKILNWFRTEGHTKEDQSHGASRDSTNH